MSGERGRPVVIAHRGASGYLPEHSLAAKALAFGQGADFLEQDIVASRDGELLVLHDLYLDNVTDVAQRYPGRQRSDGHYYCIDFDFEEIKTLTLHERTGDNGNARYPGRYPPAAKGFSVCSLTEELSFIAGLNKSAGRTVGIYPEIKSPAWHREQGVDIAPKLMGLLNRFGYPGRGGPLFVQCYEAEELKRLRADGGDALPLIQLIGSGGLADERVLDDVATYANGIGPSLKLILTSRKAEKRLGTTAVVEQANARGLAVHPYTFRADDLPAAVDSFDQMLAVVVGRLGVDGVFTDFPDLVRRWLDTQGH